MGAATTDFKVSLGHKLGSMNLKEFLDDMAGAEASSSEQEDEERDPQDIKKTVEEVWRDIQGGTQLDNDGGYAVSCEPTLGEMTLEEFLVRSGVVRGDGEAANGSFADLPPGKRTREDAYTSGFEDTGSGEGDLKRVKTAGTKFEDCPSTPRMLPYGHGHFCKPDEIVDKVAERRQRRMIKNRESAARSRARKQAYTAELEAEVANLKVENEHLKKQQAEHGVWKAKVLDILTTLKRGSGLSKTPSGLRRTNSV